MLFTLWFRFSCPSLLSQPHQNSAATAILLHSATLSSHHAVLPSIASNLHRSMISSNAIFDFSLLFFHELKSMQSTMLNNSLLLCPSYTFKPSKLFCFLILLNECYTNLLWYNIILYSIFFLYDHTSILTFSSSSDPYRLPLCAASHHWFITIIPSLPH